MGCTLSLNDWGGHCGHREDSGEQSHDLGWSEHDEGVCGLEREGMDGKDSEGEETGHCWRRSWSS